MIQKNWIWNIQRLVSCIISTIISEVQGIPLIITFHKFKLLFKIYKVKVILELTEFLKNSHKLVEDHEIIYLNALLLGYAIITGIWVIQF